MIQMLGVKNSIIVFFAAAAFRNFFIFLNFHTKTLLDIYILMSLIVIAVACCSNFIEIKDKQLKKKFEPFKSRKNAGLFFLKVMSQFFVLIGAKYIL